MQPLIPPPPSVPHANSGRLARLKSLLLRPLPTNKKKAVKQWTQAPEVLDLIHGDSANQDFTLRLLSLVQDLRCLAGDRFEELAIEAARTLNDLSLLKTKSERRRYWAELTKRWGLLVPDWVSEATRQRFLSTAALFRPEPATAATKPTILPRTGPTPAPPPKGLAMIAEPMTIGPGVPPARGQGRRKLTVRMNENARADLTPGLDYESLEVRPPGSCYSLDGRMRKR